MRLIYGCKVPNFTIIIVADIDDTEVIWIALLETRRQTGST